MAGRLGKAAATSPSLSTASLRASRCSRSAWLAHGCPVVSHVLSSDCCFAAEDHTAKNLYDFYVSVFNDYGILDKVFAGTTDNAANAVASITEGDHKDKWAGIRCFIHTLQLAVHDALKVFNAVVACHVSNDRRWALLMR